MPLSAEDKAKAKRLLLIAAILTDSGLSRKLNAPSPYLANLVDAITKDVTDANGNVLINGLRFDRMYITGVGSEGRQAIETLRAVPVSGSDPNTPHATQAIAAKLEDEFYTDPDRHRDFINAVLAELGL
jgi:hypothetical protein